MKDLDAKKCSDIYDIPPNYVKYGSEAIILPLVIIFSMSIREGIFPNKLKTAKIIPVHKGDSVVFVSNYRPISLLPVFSKIF